jgi:hypothetical protein
MVSHTIVQTHHHAPPVIELLTRFFVGHPSRAWSDAVEREAHPLFVNQVGCAIGPSCRPWLLHHRLHRHDALRHRLCPPAPARCRALPDGNWLCGFAVKLI